MDEEKTYEPIKIEIEVGRSVNPMTITDGLVRFLNQDLYGHSFGVSVEKELLAFEDIRMIGEALLSIYESHQKYEEFKAGIYRR